MVRLLDKEREFPLLGMLYELMRRNMEEIAPSGLACEWKKNGWLAEITQALEKAPRQIALVYSAGELAGFCMYYVCNGVFMVEELQLRQEFRSCSVIVELWKFFLRAVPEDTRYMEAYADAENAVSRGLLRRLGLEMVDPTADGQLLHFRGNYHEIRGKLYKKTKV